MIPTETDFENALGTELLVLLDNLQSLTLEAHGKQRSRASALYDRIDNVRADICGQLTARRCLISELAKEQQSLTVANHLLETAAAVSADSAAQSNPCRFSGSSGASERAEACSSR